MLGVLRFQASSRFLRATAVRMNLPTATRAPCSSGICFVTCGRLAGWLPKVSLVSAVFRPSLFGETRQASAHPPLQVERP